MILIAEENISEEIRVKGNIEMPPIRQIAANSEEVKQEEEKEEVKTD